MRLRSVVALWDAFPVSDGHALIVPCRHIATWFDATADERAELFGAIDAVCNVIRERWATDGFNIGINIGEAAGQTVAHLHLHVIPRRHGDVAEPRGGVRHVIPGKGNYLAGSTSPLLRLEDSATPTYSVTSDLAPPPPSSRVEVTLTTGGADPLLPRLEEDLAGATQVDVAVAFVLHSGVDRLYPHLEDLLERGGVLRLLTGDYLDISDPDALQKLIDLAALHDGDRCQLKIFVSDGRSFHPKAYLASSGGETGVAYVGSSNLSASALLDGIEWNYRVSSLRDAQGWTRVRMAFAALFDHPSTRPLDVGWLGQYRARRRSRPIVLPAPVDQPIELPPLPPQPNVAQSEALEALQETRTAGNRAGLVVMATGLGKTWLAAFDTARAEFRRILFVAHREEILNQAVATFRRIRPGSSIGLYNGTDKAPDAEILFASIQTLSRRDHLDRFERRTFDYIVVDEFHHAAAATYRRLIDHFEPAFLLGLTATPERSDGGDLLALCGENLVYRCAMPRGIELGLLCQFDYYGVPDDVDYANIPWRSNRFDEEQLTLAVATKRRAANILDQWRKRAGNRTVAFCVSQRHADFMCGWFRDQGVSCASVHAGASSDPRALSLERLSAGDIRVVFVVDMFNEGVDVPAIDTVMMLRPTESPVVWLQQFGRGLRRLGDKRLTVIDYIGNHRSFLLKVRTLLELQRAGDHELRAALERAEAGELELPHGCHVTYELEALNILRALLRTPMAGIDALREYYEDFRQRHGMRPTATETFHDGYLPRSARTRYASWFGLVREMGDLDSTEQAAEDVGRALLDALQITPMTRSFKMLLLQAMLNADALPGPGIDIRDLAAEFGRLAARSTALRADVGPELDDLTALCSMLETNPIAAWTGPGAARGDVLFAYEDRMFRYARSVPDAARAALKRLVRELVDWRLAEYLSRTDAAGDVDGLSTASFVMKVSHSGGRPILFLPDRASKPGIPHGWQPVQIEGKQHQANFVKVAINIVRPDEGEENVLPAILRGWFGPDAGLPGTDYKVACEQGDDGWVFTPMGRQRDEKLELFRRYSREQIPRLFSESFNPAIWNAGFVAIPTDSPKHLCLLVTLDKGSMASEFKYGDRFLAPDLFQWQSQNRTKRASKHGRLISEHEAHAIQVHLFVREEKKRTNLAAPFVYCGPLRFAEWEGDAPITVRWRLETPIPRRLASELDVPAG